MLAPTLVDWAVIALTLIGLPLVSTILDRRFEAKWGKKAPREEMAKAITKTLLLLWGSAGLTLAAWLVADRPITSLGLGYTPLPYDLGLSPIIGWVIAFGFALGQLARVFISMRQKEGLKDVRKMLDQLNITDLIPHTRQEMRRWVLVSFTAGFVEELVWRGFAILILAAVLPLWAAAIISLISFTLGHLYQAGNGLLRVFLMGAGFTLITMISQSLIPAMILHFSIDLISGWVGYLALQEDQEIPEADAQS